MISFRRHPFFRLFRIFFFLVCYSYIRTEAQQRLCLLYSFFRVIRLLLEVFTNNSPNKVVKRLQHSSTGNSATALRSGKASGFPFFRSPPTRADSSESDIIYRVSRMRQIMGIKYNIFFIFANAQHIGHPPTSGANLSVPLVLAAWYSCVDSLLRKQSSYVRLNNIAE